LGAVNRTLRIDTMKPPTETLTIRPAVDADIESMRTLLNEIIRVGGTTAITNELSPDEMREWFISGRDVVSCFVAVDSNRAITGFQLVGCDPIAPRDATCEASLVRCELTGSNLGATGSLPTKITQ
jgi:L-amino acid N-acyltransferase YncA